MSDTRAWQAPSSTQGLSQLKTACMPRQTNPARKLPRTIDADSDGASRRTRPAHSGPIMLIHTTTMAAQSTTPTLRHTSNIAHPQHHRQLSCESAHNECSTTKGISGRVQSASAYVWLRKRRHMRGFTLRAGKVNCHRLGNRGGWLTLLLDINPQ